MRPPVDWLLMTENSVDPGHAPFLHEGVMGSDTRAGAAPMGMALGPDGVAPRGFTVSHTGYTVKSRVGGMKATRTFVSRPSLMGSRSRGSLNSRHSFKPLPRPS